MISELARDAEEPKFTANVVLMQQKKKKVIYYLPCYVRLRVKELISVDIDELTSTVSGTLLFSFYYGNLSPEIVEQFVGGDNPILLQFSRQESIQLIEEKGITITRSEKEKVITFTIRQHFTCYIVGDVFFTPFEIVNLFLTITIQTVHLNAKENQDNKVDIKFNCMTHKDAMLIDNGEKCDYGLYSLACNFIDAKFTNVDKNPFKKISLPEDADQQQEASNSSQKDDAGSELELTTKKISIQNKQASESATKINKHEMDDPKRKHFQYAHMRIPLYKHPGVQLFQIFIPLWILSFINLVVFFQQNVLADKMATIATVTLAYIAFIPTINETVPKTPEIKLIDLLIYCNILTTIFTMIDSVITLRTKDVSYVFEWQTNGWFWITVVLSLISLIIIVVLFIIHKVYWERVYTSTKKTKSKQKELTKKIWYNRQCEKQFENDVKLGKIRVI